ncbi:MAG: hypothetical protein L0206_25100 [Actinobacteria bacterium]|nr:hypothetical protein [Actinomycetota bacterium]
MSNRLRLAAVLGVALGSLGSLAACGDDDGGGDALTKEAFIEQADAICREGGLAIEEATSGLDPNEMSEDEFADVIRDEVVARIRQQIQAVRALGFPEGDEELLDGLFDQTESVLDELDEDPQILFQDEDPLAEVNAELAEYGFTECGQ